MNRDAKTSTEPLSPVRFALLLHSVPHIGEKTLTRLLHHLALGRLDPAACLQFTSQAWQTRTELDPRAADYLCEHRDALLARSEELARTVRQHSLYVLTTQSLAYPARLERFDDSPPPIVYALGNLSLLTPQSPSRPQPQTSVSAAPVASRKTAAKRAALYQTHTDESDQAAEQSQRLPNSATDLGTQTASQAELDTRNGKEVAQEWAIAPAAVENAGRAPFTFSIAISNGAEPAALKRQDEIAGELVRRGCVPVTGHDRAPYRRLALTAQRQNRPTVYVMDRGLREVLGPEFDRPPFAAARIRETVFDASRDLALSPFRLDDHALGGNLRRRDRMIFALADLIVALDVRAGGGMAAECLRAQQQGRMVWVAAGGRDGNEELRQAGCMAMPEEVSG